MMRFLGVLVFLGLFLEIYSLILMMKWLGGFNTLGLIILGFLVGGHLVRHQLDVAKMMMMGQFMRGRDVSRLSVYEMMLPVRVPLAGFLLMLPSGFVSSLVGLVLLLPVKWGGQSESQIYNSNQSDNYNSNLDLDFEQHGFQRTNTRPKHDDIIDADYTVHHHHTNQNPNQK